MRADEGLASADVATGRPNRGVRLRGILGTGALWLLGSVVVALAQPGTDRKLAAAGAAVAGIATIVIVSRLTEDPGRRYFRSVVGAIVAVSVVGDWLAQRLTGANSFELSGVDTRIALPLIVVLLAPVVLLALPVRLRSRALWRDRTLVLRQARPMDWLMAAYALLIVPDLALGLAHHAPKSYIAQDLGLIVFFVFAYVAGRVVSERAGRALAFELVVVLLLLAGAQALFSWDTTPIFTYVEAACAGAVAFALFQPTRVRLVLLAVAVALLVRDVVQIKQGTGSTTGVEFAFALGVIAYLVVRARHLVPQWLAIAVAVVALVVFLAFTADGTTVRGQYHGTDQSNLGRAFEAHQVREAIHGSPVSLVFGRGLGGSIDETKAPATFAESLVYGGRDLAHVQQVHLLPYEVLLKYGLFGFAWLGALVLAAAILGIRALESAARHRDPTPVVYAALPVLGITAALAAATHLQDNPLNALALGILVTRFDGAALSPPPRPRLGIALPAAAIVCFIVGAVAFSGGVKPFGATGIGTVPNDAAVVGDVRIEYPRNFHRRYFATANPAVTGARAGGIQGVVVSSYRLRRSPELGGTGEVLRPTGLFFELYQEPRQDHRSAPKRKFPVTIFDLSNVRALNKTATLEQGGLRFRVKGRNYRAIVWLGAAASKDLLLTVDNIIGSIQVDTVKPRTAKPHARPRLRKH